MAQTIGKKRTETWGQMRRFAPVLALFAALSTGSARAGSCDIVLRWDERSISDCFKELRSDLNTAQVEIATLSSENKLLRGHLCLLATDTKAIGATGGSTALVIADACAELRARSKAKARKP